MSVVLLNFVPKQYHSENHPNNYSSLGTTSLKGPHLACKNKIRYEKSQE